MQDNCHAQLLAVKSLQSIFNTPTTSTKPPVAQKTRVTTPASTPGGLQAPAPAPTPASTPRVCMQTPAPLPRVVEASNPCTGTQPIAHHTRTNRANANSIAMVVSQPNTRQRTVTFALPPNHVDKYSGLYREATLNRDTTYILSAKWATVPQLRRPPVKPSQTLAQPLPTFNQFALLADDNIDDDKQPPTATAYSVLDHATGETLEHCQLRHRPKYKATWDKSYADEIGRLCQGVGQHPTMPNTQRVTGTNTMKPIMFQDIPTKP
jgi:hypothetical protein